MDSDFSLAVTHMSLAFAWWKYKGVQPSVVCYEHCNGLLFFNSEGGRKVSERGCNLVES